MSCDFFLILHSISHFAIQGLALFSQVKSIRGYGPYVFMLNTGRYTSAYILINYLGEGADDRTEFLEIM